MILHVASMAAVLVDQLAQAPVVIQCVPPAPESLWKSILQIAQTIIPVAGGVLIAWMAFRWNSKKEHERWVLDQKKAEWVQLLRSVAEVHRVLRAVSTTGKERAELIAEGLRTAVHELLISQTNCILLQAFFADPVRGKRFFSFLEEADIISGKISGLLSLIRVPLEGSSAKEKTDQLTDLQTLTREITNKYFEFQQWLRQGAASDLA